jgi:uroporphyrinogen III methyltransferase / synthase
MTRSEELPLQGKRILITRAEKQSKAFARRLRELGGEPVHFPVIQITRPADEEPLDAALDRLETFDWLVFTSANGVRHFFRRMDERLQDTRVLQSIRTAAVGPKTAEALKERKLHVLITPEQNHAEALAAALAPAVQPGEEILFPRGNLARRAWLEELELLGCRVTDVIAYETRPRTKGADRMVEQLRAGDVDIVTFTSSSTVHNFIQAVQRVEPDWHMLIDGVKTACIGPSTAAALREAGVEPDAVADPHSLDGLIQAVAEIAGNE